MPHPLMTPIRFVLIFCLPAILFLSGCAKEPDFIALSPGLQGNIHGTNAHIKSCPEEMRTEIKPSQLGTTAPEGKLLFALIDCAIEAHRESCAKEAITEIQKALKSYDFKEKYENRLRTMLKNTPWMNIKNIHMHQELHDDKREAILDKAAADGVLTVHVDYCMDPEFRLIKGTLMVNLYATGPQLIKQSKVDNPKETPIYRLTLRSGRSLPDATYDIDKNAEIWAMNDGAYARQSMQILFDDLFEQLKQALANPTRHYE